MEPLISGAFAHALEAGRGRFNAGFTMARRTAPNLEAAAFAGHLAATVAPIVEAVAAYRLEAVREVVDVLYEYSLELVGKGYLERYPAILDGWRRLLPARAACLAQDPRRFAGSVTNALHNLASTPGGRPGEWIDGLLALDHAQDDPALLLDAGKVLSWRAGMAHYRKSALNTAATLPPVLALEALGVPRAPGSALGGLLSRLADNPWRTPDAALAGSPASEPRVVARVGAFRGFGGLFIRPPRVLAAGDDLFVTDGEGCWSLHADVFGAVFQRSATAPMPSGGGSPYRLDNGRLLSGGTAVAHLPQLTVLASQAGVGVTHAATLPNSHAVYLIAAG